VVRRGTKQNEKNIYQSFVLVAKPPEYYTQYIRFVWSPRIALTAVLLIIFDMEPSEIHNTQIPGG
jgi:hypothetical protein